MSATRTYVLVGSGGRTVDLTDEQAAACGWRVYPYGGVDLSPAAELTPEERADIAWRTAHPMPPAETVVSAHFPAAPAVDAATAEAVRTAHVGRDRAERWVHVAAALGVRDLEAERLCRRVGLAPYEVVGEYAWPDAFGMAAK